MAIMPLNLESLVEMQNLFLTVGSGMGAYFVTNKITGMVMDYIEIYKEKRAIQLNP